jgi:hypothetical protein
MLFKSKTFILGIKFAPILKKLIKNSVCNIKRRMYLFLFKRYNKKYHKVIRFKRLMLLHLSYHCFA